MRWRATQSGDLRHPREMDVADVGAFLSMLSNEREVISLVMPKGSKTGW